MSEDTLREESPISDSKTVPTQLEETATSGSIPTHREGSRERRLSDDRGSAESESTEARDDIEPQSGTSRQPANAPWAVLPDELVHSYEFVRQSSVVGAEGTLFEVLEADTRIPRILKLYAKGVNLKPESLRRIQTIESKHVARLIEYAQLNDGRWYEVQEKLECGSLLEYRQRMGNALEGSVLENVIEQLSKAVAAFHQVGIAHQDIKPENILIRSERPLELVLADFGLSVVADHRTYYATSINATIAYQAPETMRLVGGEPRDYWALGLTIAALATGRPPYEGLNQHGILTQHYRRVPPQIVESISDRRVRQLCRGLTRYEPKNRWTIREIQEWLDGKESRIESETSVPVRSQVEFNDKAFAEEKALAEEIVRCWTAAAQVLGVSSRRTPFIERVSTTFGTQRIAQLKARWQENPPSLNRVDHAIVELILTLDPGRQPCYGDRPLAIDSILAASTGDSQEDRDFIEKLHTSRILEAWAELSDNANLAQIAKKWRRALHRAEEIANSVGSRGAESLSISELRGPLLAVAVDANIRRQWSKVLERKRPRGPLLPSWYDPIAERSDPADLVAAVSLADEARRVQATNKRRHHAARHGRIKERWGPICTLLTVLSWLFWIVSLSLQWMAPSAEVFHGVLGLLLFLHTFASGTALQVIPGASASLWVLSWFFWHGIDFDILGMEYGAMGAEHGALVSAALATLSSICSFYVARRGRLPKPQSGRHRRSRPPRRRQGEL